MNPPQMADRSAAVCDDIQNNEYHAIFRPVFTCVKTKIDYAARPRPKQIGIGAIQDIQQLRFKKVQYKQVEMNLRLKNEPPPPGPTITTTKRQI